MNSWALMSIESIMDFGPWAKIHDTAHAGHSGSFLIIKSIMDFGPRQGLYHDSTEIHDTQNPWYSAVGDDQELSWF